MIVVSLVCILSLLALLGLSVRLLAALVSSRSRVAIREHPIAHTALAGFVIIVWFAPWGWAAGYLAAKWDIAHGHYATAVHGMYRPSLPIYSRLLKERYNIHCPDISSCLVLPSESEYNSAYNAVASPAIIAIFGKDVFKECRIAAEAELHTKLKNQ